MKRKEIVRTAVQITSIGTAILSSATPVSANQLMETEWFTGAMQLISDATAAGLIIFPLAGILVSMYFWFRRGVADPEEKKRWQDRAVGAMLIGAIIGLVSGVSSLITSYLT